MSQASIVLGQGVVPQEQKAGEECCGEHSPRHQQFGQTLRHHTAQLSALQQTSTDTLYWAPTLVSHHSKPSPTLVFCCSSPQKANSECNATDNSFLMATQPVQQTVRKYKYRALWASEHELNISPDNTSTGHFRHVNMN